jgi:aprataxin
MISWLKNLISPQKVIVLVGLPGAGKTTYAQKFKDKGYVIVNQDHLGDVKQCLRLTRQALLQGKSVVIDRTNVSLKQRALFLDIAREFDVKCECHVLSTGIRTCLERVKNRKNHPTMVEGMTDEEKSEVVQFFATEYQAPLYTEGFSVVSYVS